MKKYDDYKDSGIEWIGEIPEHWEVKKLGFVFNSLNTKRIPLSAEERGIMKTKIYDYYGASGVIDKVDDFLFDENLILIGEDGANLLTRSKRLAFIASGKYWVNNHAHIIKPINGNLNYFCEFLELIDYTIYITGSAQPKLTQEALMSIKTIEPPILEQNVIANYLDHKTTQINNLISKKQQFITLLQEERIAVINQAVTKGLDPKVKMKDSGIEWLGEIPEHWELWKISHAFNKIGSGTTPESGNPIYHENGSINWLNTGDLNDGILNSCKKKVTEKALNDYSSLKLFPAGSLVIAMYGATIGKTCIINFETTTNQACCVLCKNDIININFLQYWFIGKKEHIINLAIGGGQPNISQNILKDVRVNCPNMAEQKKIVDYIHNKTNEIDKIIFKVNEEIELLKEYKTALISEAVTGKVDVRDVVLN